MKLKDLIIEKKEDVIKVQGVGIFTYKTLKNIFYWKTNLKILRKLWLCQKFFIEFEKITIIEKY